METAMWFKMFLFLVIAGSVISFLTPGSSLPASPNLGNLTIFNFTGVAQIPLMNTSATTTCTVQSSNASQVCYYQYSGCTYAGCPKICYDPYAGWLDFSGIVHSLWCLAEGFIWMVAVVVNFFIMIANFVIWVINVGVSVITILIALGGYMGALVVFFTGIGTLFNSPLIPAGLGVIFGMIVLFMWIFLAIEVITRIKGMVFPS